MFSNQNILLQGEDVQDRIVVENYNKAVSTLGEIEGEDTQSIICITVYDRQHTHVVFITLIP